MEQPINKHMIVVEPHKWILLNDVKNSGLAWITSYSSIVLRERNQAQNTTHHIILPQVTETGKS